MSFSSSQSNSTEENSENEFNLSETELDFDISKIFLNLSLTEVGNSSNNCEVNMAVPHFETKLLEIVPKFDGNPLELSSFLDTANTLYNTYWDPTPTNRNSVQNVTLIYGIYAKLIGKAREVYSICISKDWQSVKSALIAHFGDQRDENGLLFDLDQMRQNNNEPSLQFYTRIMSTLSALHNYVDTHENVAATIIVKKEFYNKHALKIFLAGLKEPLGSTIRAMRPDCLATAQQYIISENNIHHLQKSQVDYQKNRPPQKYNNNNNTQPQKFYNNNTQPQKFYNHNFQPNFPQQFTYSNPSFPRGPINVQPRSVPFQRFPTNRQVFGPPKNPTNVWKPNFQNQLNQPKPTPMSGISHGTFPRPTTMIQQQPRYSRPNFTSEELYNVEQPHYYDPNVSGPSYQYNNYETEYFYTNLDPSNDPNLSYNQYNQYGAQENFDEQNAEYVPEQNGDSDQNFQEIKPPDHTI